MAESRSDLPSNGFVIFVLHTDFLVFVFCHKRSNRPDVNHQAIRFQVATHAKRADGLSFLASLRMVTHSQVGFSGLIKGKKVFL